jgi:DNA-binding MarR family transcriptional regulator
MDRCAVSRQTRHLVDAGLVTREPDPDDGRACLLSLSLRGRTVLDAVREARCEALGAALGAWPENERVAIADALSRLADDLQASAHGVPMGGAAPPSPGSNANSR